MDFSWSLPLNGDPAANFHRKHQRVQRKRRSQGAALTLSVSLHRLASAVCHIVVHIELNSTNNEADGLPSLLRCQLSVYPAVYTQSAYRGENPCIRLNNSLPRTPQKTAIDPTFMIFFDNYIAKLRTRRSIYSTTKGGSYVTLSGTSMAAPHLAGLLLLGNVNSGGSVQKDPDNNPDVIGVH